MRTIVARDEGAARLGELALVDDEGRIGKLDTVFYDTLLDENAASHIAIGVGFPFAAPPRQRATASTSRDPHRLHDRPAGARVTGITRRRRARSRARSAALAASDRYPFARPGEVPERLNGHDWKSCVGGNLSEGSNPSLSVGPCTVPADGAPRARAGDRGGRLHRSPPGPAPAGGRPPGRGRRRPPRHDDPGAGRARLAGLDDDPGFDLAEVDLTNDDLTALVARVRPRAIFHLAARPGVRDTDEAALFRDNVQATAGIVAAAAAAGVPDLVFASSSSVYGDAGTHGACRESMPSPRFRRTDGPSARRSCCACARRAGPRSSGCSRSTDPASVPTWRSRASSTTRSPGVRHRCTSGPESRATSPTWTTPSRGCCSPASAAPRRSTTSPAARSWSSPRRAG